LPICRWPLAMEGLAAQTRGIPKPAVFFNYENDSNDSFARVRLICRGVFSLGQTAGNGSSNHAEFPVRCGASATGHGEGGGSKKKQRGADPRFDARRDTARVSHAKRAAVVAERSENSKPARHGIARPGLPPPKIIFKIPPKIALTHFRQLPKKDAIASWDVSTYLRSGRRLPWHRS
jgi:hypothetical protein